MSRISLRPRARLEVDEIFDRIAADDVATAMAFIRRIEDKLELLTRFPEMGASRRELQPGIRSHPASDTYTIYYRPQEDGIEVVRVLRSRRDIGPDDIARHLQDRPDD